MACPRTDDKINPILDTIIPDGNGCLVWPGDELHDVNFNLKRHLWNKRGQKLNKLDKLSSTCKKLNCVNMNHFTVYNKYNPDWDSIFDRLMTNSEKVGDCQIWKKCKKFGYGMSSIYGKDGYAHRIMYMCKTREYLPLEDDNGDMIVVRHKCPNTDCIDFNHLELGTKEDNASDMVRDGTRKKGEDNNFCKISEDKARMIKLSRLMKEKMGIPLKEKELQDST